MNPQITPDGPPSESGISPKYTQPELPLGPSDKELAERQAGYKKELGKFKQNLAIKLKIKGVVRKPGNSSPPTPKTPEEAEKSPTAWEELHGTKYSVHLKKHNARKSIRKYGRN